MCWVSPILVTVNLLTNQPFFSHKVLQCCTLWIWHPPASAFYTWNCKCVPCWLLRTFILIPFKYGWRLTASFLGLKWRYLSAVFSDYNTDHSHALAIPRITTQFRDGSIPKPHVQCSPPTRQILQLNRSLNLHFKDIGSSTFTRCQHQLRIRKFTPTPRIYFIPAWL